MKLTTCKACKGFGEISNCTCDDGAPCDRACRLGVTLCYDCEGAGEILSTDPVTAFDLAQALLRKTPVDQCQCVANKLLLIIKGNVMAEFMRAADGASWAWESQTIAGPQGVIRGHAGASADLDVMIAAALSFPIGIASPRGAVVVRWGHVYVAALVIHSAGGDPFGRTASADAQKALKSARLPMPGSGLLKSDQGGTWSTRAILEACEAILPIH